MRKVKFKKWIKAVFPEWANSVNCQTTHPPIAGTNCFETDFINDGIFHQWGLETTESNYELINRTVAIIEQPDGTIENVLPENIKFLN
jgi:hypothetical protein